MEQDIKNNILEKIKTGDVSMRPKAYFVTGMIALICLAFFVTVTSILLISYTLFSIVVSGHMLLLGFGWRGIVAFFILFPWFTFLADILLLLALDWLIRRFKFGYNRPIVYLFFGTTILLVCLGYVVSVTSLHGELLHRAEHKQFPPMFGSLGPVVGPAIQPMYANIRASHRESGVMQGTVTSISGNTFTIFHDDYDVDLDNATTTIITPTGTDVGSLLNIGDHVLVGGDIMPDGSVHSYGVTKFASQ